MTSLASKPRRMITVYYRDKNDVQQKEERRVFWARGFGHYFKWGRRQIIIGPMDTAATTDYPLGT